MDLTKWYGLADSLKDLRLRNQVSFLHSVNKLVVSLAKLTAWWLAASEGDATQRAGAQKITEHSAGLMKDLRHEYSNFKQYSSEPLLSTLPHLFNPTNSRAGSLDGKVASNALHSNLVSLCDVASRALETFGPGSSVRW